MLTPLKCMSIFADEISKSVTTESEREKALGILHASSMLKFQVNQMLDRSMLDNGSFSISIRKCNLSYEMKSLHKLMTVQAKTRNVRLRLELALE